MSQELYAQLQVTRRRRRLLGRIPAVCWTDHANCVRTANRAEAEEKHVRWVAEIESDGSRLKNLCGKSAVLGDVLSRSPVGASEAMLAPLRKFRDFSLDDYLDECEGPGLQADGAGTHAVELIMPSKPGGHGWMGQLLAAASSRPKVRVGILPFGGSEERQQRLQASCWRKWSEAYPAVEFEFVPLGAPFSDERGREYFFDGRLYQQQGAAVTKGLRREALTGMAHVLRAAAERRVSTLCGLGQGGVICALLSLPRLVELALFRRAVPPAEGPALSQAWLSMRAFVAVGPYYRISGGTLKQLLEAVPELGEPGHQERRKTAMFLDGSAGAAGSEGFAKELMESVSGDAVAHAGEMLLDGLMGATNRPDLTPASGRCACGRAALILPRCMHCAREDARERGDALAAEAGALESEGEDADEEGSDALAVVASLRLEEDHVGPIVYLREEHLPQLRPRQAGRWLEVGSLVVGRFCVNTGVMALPTPSPDKEFRVMFWRSSSQQWGVFQHCVPWRHEVVRSAAVVELAGADVVELLAVASHRWMVFDRSGWADRALTPSRLVPSQPPEVAVLPATHAHRHIRGGLKTAKGWVNVATYTSAYSPTWAALLARIYHQELKKVKRGAAVPTKLSREADAAEPQQELGGFFMGATHGATHAELSTLPSDLELEGERVLKEMTQSRERFAEEARDEGEEYADKFELGPSLRAKLVADQWSDPEIRSVALKASAAARRARKEEEKAITALGKSWRLGPDRAVEVASAAPGEKRARWVPAIPSKGSPGGGKSWKAFLFASVHVGPMGGHRPADKSAALLLRTCWWSGLVKDVEHFVSRCWQCLQFRKVPQKLPASFIVTGTLGPWQHVVMDCEGPVSPTDRDGYRYVLTYLCSLSGGALFEPLRNLGHSEFRTGFSRCVFRSGTVPARVSSDCGTEMRNAAMAELKALMNIGSRFGTPWRPVEQGAVERQHQEASRERGLLLLEVFKAFGTEWASMLPACEFLLYNTPRGDSGLTPRDLDRRWSLA